MDELGCGDLGEVALSSVSGFLVYLRDLGLIWARESDFRKCWTLAVQWDLWAWR